MAVLVIVLVLVGIVVVDSSPTAQRVARRERQERQGADDPEQVTTTP